MLKEGCRCLAQVSSVCQTTNLEQPNLFQILLAGGYRTICLGKIQLGWGTDLSWQNEAQPAWRWTGLVKVTVNIYLLLKLLFITQHLLVTNLLKFLTLLKHLLASSSLTSSLSWNICYHHPVSPPKEGMNPAFYFCYVLHSMWHNAEHKENFRKCLLTHWLISAAHFSDAQRLKS